MKLTLLGTGIPVPDPYRRGSSQVIESDGQLVLVDCGSGAAQRLAEAGYPRPALHRLVITHLHSDHITGLPDLLWGGWVGRWWDEPPVISGPVGTAHLVDRLIDAFSFDIEVRMKGERLKREWLVPRVEEIDEGWTAEGSDWRLTVFRVDHQPVEPAFGYRMDADSSSIVISGDTNASDNLVRHAHGVDLLVHEVYWAHAMQQQNEGLTDPDLLARRRTITSYHTPSTEVGKVAARAEARHLVLSHILLRGGTPADLLADVRPDFPGNVTVGEDLLTFAVGAEASSVRSR
jgi:ribonuclease Z